MNRVRFEEHQGKEILLLDFSNCTANEALEITEEARKLIAEQPKQSLRILVNVKNARFDSHVIEVTKSFREHNDPYVKKRAVFGLEGIQEIVYDAITRFPGKKSSSMDEIEKQRETLPRFGDLEAAKDWLVED